MVPETRYALNKGGQYVAYQAFGAGDVDLVFIPDWCTNLEIMWEEPTLARFLQRLASFSRVICFDKRGTGVSDPVPLGAIPTWEEWMDDVGTVLDAVGSQRAAVFGHGDGGCMALLFAASHPGRTSALILADTYARRRRAAGLPLRHPRRRGGQDHRGHPSHLRNGRDDSVSAERPASPTTRRSSPGAGATSAWR